MFDSVVPVISAVVTFHGEGLLAHKTLLGLERVRVYTEARGIPVELVAVLDCADSETKRVVKSSPVLRAGDQVLEVNNRDLGASRNSGVGVARGSHIGIFDGDDYYTKNWLVQALAVIKDKQGDVVVHPEKTISFGTVHCVSEIWDMDDRNDFSLSNCLVQHPWISCSFGKKALYQKHPYHRTDSMKTGFGYEDWHWNLDLVGDEIRHVTAKKTALFYRRKAVSMLTGMVAAGVVIRPSEFFNQPDKWGKPAIPGQEAVSEGRPTGDTYQQSYLEEVIAGKDWLEGQWKALQEEVARKDAQLARLRSSMPVRVLKKIGVISNV